jgi:hypothetical protein
MIRSESSGCGNHEGEISKLGPPGARLVLDVRSIKRVAIRGDMFHRVWWRLRTVRSDEGFVVRFIGLRRGIEYKENSQVFRLEVERAASGVDWIVYAKSLVRLLSKEQTEPVSEQTRERICERVRSALSFLGIRFAMD